MAHVHVPDWSPEQVVLWLKGLDDVLLPYTHNFLNNGITGRHLVCFAADDLPHLGVNKLGHQELILEAVELLKQFYHNLETENLQWLSLRLSCKARGIYKELSYQEAMNQPAVTSGGRCQDRVATKTLSTVVDVIDAVMAVVTWLDKIPFKGQEYYVNLRNDLLKSSIVLATNAQRDSFAEEPNVVIKNICCKMAEKFDELTKNNCDSLFIQPTHLEVVVVKKKPNEELGLRIQTSFSGNHVIGYIHFQSPASSCGRGRIDLDDEIVQVNYQTVIGWHQKNLVSLMKSNPTEVILTLKKRPMHSNTSGQVIPHKLFFPMKKPPAYLAKHDWDPSASAPVTISITDVNNKTSSIPNLNVGKSVETHANVKTAQEAVLEPKLQTTATHILPEATEDDDDDSTFLPEEETKSEMSGELAHLATPRVQVTLQRRCTVSGGSPTAERPPVSIDQLWNGMKREQVMRTQSHDVTRAEWRWRMSEFTPRQLETIASRLAPLAPNQQFASAARESGDKRVTAENETLSCAKEIESLSKNNDGAENPNPAAVVEMEVVDSQPDNLSAQVAEKSTAAEEGRPPSVVRSYQVVIVGGVPQVVTTPKDKEAKKNSSESPVLRHKMKSLQAVANRRISCKDLGQGDCQGWLLKGLVPKGTLAGFKWSKAWCVLKGRYFYVFRDLNAVKAECFISLPAFHVSPAPECRSKKFGFKVYNAGATFYFASDSKTDMSKWMNKMGLAAIEYIDSGVEKNTDAGCTAKAKEETDEFFSETDESDDGNYDSNGFHQPARSPLQKSATDTSMSDNRPSSPRHSPLLSKSTWGGSLPRLSSSRSNNYDSHVFLRPATPAKVPLSPRVASTKKPSLEEYRGGTLPVSFSKRKWPGLTKSGSLEWKAERRKNNPAAALSCGDHACSEPTVYGGHCAVEPGAKMALAFEMNLDSSSPPRDTHSGDEGSPNAVSKSSLRLFGSPKFVKKLSKIRQACNTVWFDEGPKSRADVPVSPNAVAESDGKTRSGFGSETVPRENFGCAERRLEAPRASTKKPAMGVSMIGKQRRTSSQSSGDSVRSQTMTRSQGATITQSTQTDEARLAALALHDDGDFGGLSVDEDGEKCETISSAVNPVHVGAGPRKANSRQARVKKLRRLKRSLRIKMEELADIESLLVSPLDSASVSAFTAKYPRYLKSCP